MNNFESRKNTVVRLDNGNIQKTVLSKDAFEREAEVLKVLNGRHAPRLLFECYPTLEMECISGELLLDKYLSANAENAVLLATALSKTVREIFTLTDKITFDENFRNYIISGDGDCYRVDFEETTRGTLVSYVAKISAFAALYDVETQIKHAFISTLINILNLDKETFLNAFKAELEFLSKRWGVPLPKDFSENLF